MAAPYGVGAPVSIQPGDRALLLGSESIPGFFGSGGSGYSAPGSAVTLQASQASRPVVIAAMGGRHPATQRQLIWRVFPTGSVNLLLQVSIDNEDVNYVTIDSYSGNTNSGARVITADVDAAGQGGPAAQGTAKILSAARFIRVKEGSGSSPATAIADCTAL